MNELKESEDKLIGYLRDAAKLRLEIEPFENDQRKDNNVFFAIDTNILNLYLMPQMVGPKNKNGGGGYGVVFHDDDEETAKTLGAALSRVIFYSLSKPPYRPLIMLPGHDSEIRFVYESIQRVSLESMEKTKERRNEFKSLLSKLGKNKTNTKFFEELENKAELLMSFLFFQEDSNALLNRINGLMKEVRIARLNNFALNYASSAVNKNQNSKIAQAFALPNKLFDQFEESKYRIQWEKRLKSIATKRPEKRLHPDCDALARLELINRHLRNTGNSLVLITGDESMMKAAWDYFPYEDIELSFATLYLRHPRAFLAAPEVLLPNESQQSKPLDLVKIWLDTFLANYTDKIGIQGDSLRLIVNKDRETLETLRELAHIALDRNNETAKKIKEEWLAHTECLQVAHSGTSNLARDEISRIFGKKLEPGINEYLEKIEDIEKIITEKSEETWQEFLETLMQAGFELISSDSLINQRKRNIPPINFHSFKNTSKSIRLIINITGAKQLNNKDIKNFEDTMKEIKKDDPTGYALCLAYAFLYACANRWHVAYQLTQRAIDIAEEIDLSQEDFPENISGREAYFFKAVLKRLGAQSINELLEVEHLLTLAEKALEKDKSRKIDTFSNGMRIKSEKIGLELSFHLFNHFLLPKKPPFSTHRNLRELFFEFIDTHEQILKDTDVWARICVERTLLVNIFMIFALLEDAKMIDSEIESKAIMEYKRFRKNIEYGNSQNDFKIPLSKLVESMLRFADIRFGGKNLNKKKILKELKDSGKKDPDLNERGAPYDKKRIELLVKLADLAIRSQGQKN